MNIGNRKQLLPPFFQPYLGISAMALRTTAVAAGVVDVVLLTTMIAWQQLPAQRLGPAPENIIHRLAMAGQQVLSKPLQVVTPIAPQDVCHLWHAHAPTCLEVCHKRVDGGMYNVEGFVREMCVAGGSTGAVVPEQFLDDAP